MLVVGMSGPCFALATFCTFCSLMGGAPRGLVRWFMAWPYHFSPQFDELVGKACMQNRAVVLCTTAGLLNGRSWKNNSDVRSTSPTEPSTPRIPLYPVRLIFAAVVLWPLLNSLSLGMQVATPRLHFTVKISSTESWRHVCTRAHFRRFPDAVSTRAGGLGTYSYVQYIHIYGGVPVYKTAPIGFSLQFTVVLASAV